MRKEYTFQCADTSVNSVMGITKGFYHGLMRRHQHVAKSLMLDFLFLSEVRTVCRSTGIVHVQRIHLYIHAVEPALNQGMAQLTVKMFNSFGVP